MGYRQTGRPPGRPKGRVPLVKDPDRQILLSAFFQLYRPRGEKLRRGVKAAVFRALAEFQLGAREYGKSDLPEVRSWLVKHPKDDPDTDIDDWRQRDRAARMLGHLPSIDDAWTADDIFNDPAKVKAFTRIRRFGHGGSAGNRRGAGQNPGVEIPASRGRT